MKKFVLHIIKFSVVGAILMVVIPFCWFWNKAAALWEETRG